MKTIKNDIVSSETFNSVTELKVSELTISFFIVFITYFFKK